MRKYLKIIVVLLVCTTVNAQLRRYHGCESEKIYGEKVTLEISQLPIKATPPTKGLVIGAVLGALLPPAIDLATSVIKSNNENNIKQFKATYKCFNSGKDFYKDSATINLPILTINRDVYPRKDSDEESTDLAFSIVLHPDISPDNTAFRYHTPKEFYFKYSKAKTRKRHPYLNLDFQIQIKALSVEENKPAISEIRTTSISIPMVKNGKEKVKMTDVYYSGWIPLLPRDAKIKRSGLYEIEVTVTETNPYLAVAEKNSGALEKTSESGTVFIKEVTKVIFGKEEKTKEEAEGKEVKKGEPVKAEARETGAQKPKK